MPRLYWMRPSVRPTIPEIYTVQQIVNGSGRRTAAEGVAVANSFEFGPSTEYVLFGGNWARLTLAFYCNCKLQFVIDLNLAADLSKLATLLCFSREQIRALPAHMHTASRIGRMSGMANVTHSAFDWNSIENTYTSKRRATCTERTKRPKTTINAVSYTTKRMEHMLLCNLSHCSWFNISHYARYVRGISVLLNRTSRTYKPKPYPIRLLWTASAMNAVQETHSSTASRWSDRPMACLAIWRKFFWKSNNICRLR